MNQRLIGVMQHFCCRPYGHFNTSADGECADLSVTAGCVACSCLAALHTSALTLFHCHLRLDHRLPFSSRHATNMLTCHMILL